MIAALLLLLSCSDQFNAIDPAWHLGVRKELAATIVQQAGESCLELRATNGGVGDLVRAFPRPVLRSEHPFAIAHVWLPPFNEWPQNDANYCGFRLTISDQYPRFVWPGIFISRVGGVTALTCRVLVDSATRPVATSGWWSLGLGVDDIGLLSFYACSGARDLTEADRFYTDTSGYMFVSSFDGWFLQVATPQPWYFGDVQLYADVRPTLSIARDGSNVTLSADPLFRIERSTDLLSWSAFAGTVDAISETSQFYRLSR